MMKRPDARIKKLGAIFGQEDMTATIMYPELKFNDIISAMSRYNECKVASIFLKIEIFDLGLEKSGQQGI